MVYKNEHCEECNDSYALSSDKKSCNIICLNGNIAGSCTGCSNPST